jgi:4-hydroxy-tetrahydrodipicolinate synthase
VTAGILQRDEQARGGTLRPPRFGLSCALVTPFRDDGDVDVARLVDHARSRLAVGCASVTLFGTTGEGASIEATARDRVLEAFKASGIDVATRVVTCVCASAAGDARAQQRAAARAGSRTLLIAPPSYFKGVGDAGLQAWFAAVLGGAAAEGQRALLYHIPSVTAVPLSADLIARLRDAFPATVVGVKDSSGDWPYGRSLLERFPDLQILIGDERRLAQAVRLGASGAISGLANVVPERLRPLVDTGIDDPAIAALVDLVLRFPVTPAVKELVAMTTGEGAWRRVAPPLAPLSPAQRSDIADAFDGIVDPCGT